MSQMMWKRLAVSKTQKTKQMINSIRENYVNENKEKMRLSIKVHEFAV